MPKKLPNEFKGIEYETKYDLQVIERGQEPEPEEYLMKIIKKINIKSGFIKEDSILKRDSENFYYGKDDEDILTVMKKRDYNRLKYKESLTAEVEKVKHMLKRKETVNRGCSNEDVFKEIQRVTLEGAEFKGRIQRNRARTDFISIKTGRFYTVVLDICDVFREEKEPTKKRQIEVEYIGYLSDSYKGFMIESEKQIALDLVNLSKVIQKKATGLKVNKYKIKSLKPTSERKYDFLK